MKIEELKRKWIEQLKKDTETIINYKLPKAIEQGNDGTYRNLTKTVAENISLIEKNDFQQMATNYRDEKGNLHVAYWMQDGDYNIKDNNDFIVEEEDNEGYGGEFNVIGSTVNEDGTISLNLEQDCNGVKAVIGIPKIKFSKITDNKLIAYAIPVQNKDDEHEYILKTKTTFND